MLTKMPATPGYKIDMYSLRENHITQYSVSELFIRQVFGFSMFHYFVSGLGESLLQSWLFCNSELARSAYWNGMSTPLTTGMIGRFFVAPVSMGSIKQSPLGLKKNGTEYLSVLIDRLTRCLVAR